MQETELVKLLINKGYTIASAESCTAGLFAATIVNVADASKVINSSVVTYSNEAKTKYAAVNPETIEKYNVVSENVAKEMAEGIAKECGANIGVGITGLAGPGGGTEELPVGTVCFGLSINGNTVTYKQVFSGDRQQVRYASVDFVITKLIELLNK